MDTLHLCQGISILRWRLRTHEAPSFIMITTTEFTRWTASCLLFLFLLTSPSLAQTPSIKALVGGTLIDGFGGTPLHNSVILMRALSLMSVRILKPTFSRYWCKTMRSRSSTCWIHRCSRTVLSWKRSVILLRRQQAATSLPIRSSSKQRLNRGAPVDMCVIGATGTREHQKQESRQRAGFCLVC